MNEPFPEVLLREDVLITDRLLTLLPVVDGPSPLDSVYYAKLKGPRWVTGVQGCPEEHWDKTLMLTITGREARDRGKRARANGPGNAKSSRERHPYS